MFIGYYCRIDSYRNRIVEWVILRSPHHIHRRCRQWPANVLSSLVQTDYACVCCSTTPQMDPVERFSSNRMKMAKMIETPLAALPHSKSQSDDWIDDWRLTYVFNAQTPRATTQKIKSFSMYEWRHSSSAFFFFIASDTHTQYTQWRDEWMNLWPNKSKFIVWKHFLSKWIVRWQKTRAQDMSSQMSRNATNETFGQMIDDANAKRMVFDVSTLHEFRSVFRYSITLLSARARAPLVLMNSLHKFFFFCVYVVDDDDDPVVAITEISFAT